MKRAFILITFIAAAIGSKAQTKNYISFDKLPEAFAGMDMLGKYLVSNGSEQGRNYIDSLYYLNTKTYALPYSIKKDKDFVNLHISAIIASYDRDLPNHTGGYCSTSNLESDVKSESKRVEMYYGEDLAPHIVGGEGRNYAVLRMRDKANPTYRSIVGMEWWKETEGNKKDIIKLQTFKLFGPQSDMRKTSSSSPGYIALSLQTKEELLKAIKMLADMYKHDGGETDRPIATAINERIKAYMRLNNPLTHPDEDELKLFRALEKIPGYYVYIKFAEGNMTCDFGKYASMYPKLDIFCTSFDEFVDVCADDETVFTTGDINFLYQVIVNNMADEIYPKSFPAKTDIKIKQAPK